MFRLALKNRSALKPMRLLATPEMGYITTNTKNLDKNGEPRFLEQVKMFYAGASSKTDIPQEYLDLI